MKKTILVVDDEKDILDLLTYNLQKAGYAVLTARDGTEALQQAHRRLPDLILLDVMLPEMDGWEVCKELKRDPPTAGIPVVFLTAKDTEFDEVLGLELGADDYIAKPIALRSLLARVRAAIRRREALTGNVLHDEVIRIDNVEINVPSYTVTVNNTPVVLTRREFETLLYLARNRGRVITRDVLLSTVWGDDVRVIDRTVDVHISKIREKLGAYGEYIETVKGVGYRMRA
ncbi:MAG: DNA-binding response regulator [Ignavibacteria bacterium]